ncbi:hypothetical protein Tco_0079564 [Tanacetum coccineum]
MRRKRIVDDRLAYDELSPNMWDLAVLKLKPALLRLGYLGLGSAYTHQEIPTGKIAMVTKFAMVKVMALFARKVLTAIGNFHICSIVVGMMIQTFTLCGCKEDLNTKVHAMIYELAKRRLRSLVVAK